jgi:hypothetical protein
MDIVGRDGTTKQAQAARRPFDTFMVGATRGIRFPQLPAAIHTVLVAPSFVSRPWVNSAMTDGRLIVIVPVADESLGDAATTTRLHRLSRAYRARYRLDLLRVLGDGPRSLTELTDALGVGSGQLRRDLLRLRSAGLVQLNAADHRFSLRGEPVSDFGRLLDVSVGAGGRLRRPGAT